MNSGGSGGCRSRGRCDAIPNPVSRTSPVRPVHQNIGWLDILVDQAALVRLAQRGCDADRKPQEVPQL